MDIRKFFGKAAGGPSSTISGGAGAKPAAETQAKKEEKDKPTPAAATTGKKASPGDYVWYIIMTHEWLAHDAVFVLPAKAKKPSGKKQKEPPTSRKR